MRRGEEGRRGEKKRGEDRRGEERRKNGRSQSIDIATERLLGKKKNQQTLFEQSFQITTHTKKDDFFFLLEFSR